MVGSVGRGIRCKKQDNWSKMTRITVVLQDLGRSMMKSSVTWDQGCYCVGSSNTPPPPQGKVQGILACAWDKQDKTNL